MTAKRGAWRYRGLAALVALLMLSTMGGPSKRASAQSLPGGLPSGVNSADYQDELTAIQAAWSTCMQAAGGDKKQQKQCTDIAKDQLSQLIKTIKDDIKKAEGDHGSEIDPGPVDVPGDTTEPPVDVPQVPPTDTQAPIVTGPRYDAEVLVLWSGVPDVDGTYPPSLDAIVHTLDYLGTPYEVFNAGSQTLTADRLYSGERSFYSGVILTDGDLYSASEPGNKALSLDEWTTLANYEAAFKLRQVTWETWPQPDYGFNYPAAGACTESDIDGTLTTTGRQVFSYLTLAPIQIRDAWTCLATPVDATMNPLITANGNTLAGIKTYPDGRQNLAVTFATNDWSIHSYQVSYGLINWVTNGRFVGQKRIYADAQVDDVFYPTGLFDPAQPELEEGSQTYRMSGDDLKKTEEWQKKWQGQAIAKELRLSMAFNGEGTTGDADYQPDTLTPKARELQAKFKWINHTWTHMLLNDAGDGTPTAADVNTEIKLNLDLAKIMGFTDYSPKSLVTPEISGLFNPVALQEMVALGIEYVVSDTSRMPPWYDPAKPDAFALPGPNAGEYNALAPSILMIPRRPTNLYYNVSTPAEWVAEYHKIHGAYWASKGRPQLTYQEILEEESTWLLRYMLRGEIYPWMFHQANLRFYDGKRSLLTDLLDATLNKYKALFRLPVLSPRMDVTAKKVMERMDFDKADVAVTFNQGSNNVTLSNTSTTTAVVPITGIKSGNTVATYFGVPTSYITVPAGQTITLPIN